MSSLAPTISSEWIKFRTVRSTIYTLATTVVLSVGIGALLSLGSRVQYQHNPGVISNVTFDPTGISLAGFTLANIAIGVIGVLVMSSEYSSGLIRATLAATPRRTRVLAAKAIVLFCAILVVGEVCSFASFFVGQAVLRGATPTDTLGSPGALRAVVLAGLSLALLALLALGIATMLRHTAGSVTVYVGVLMILLLITLALPDSWNVHVFKFLPWVLASSMRAATPVGDGTHAFSAWYSTIVLALYAIGSLVLGGVVLMRRDA